MRWTVDVENVAGIRDGRARIEPGVNAIKGTNWQGKSSFVAAVETAMGTETVLTEGEDEGRVELSTPDETVVMELRRDGDTVAVDGKPLLSAKEMRVAASHFAFLDDTNPVRRAVRRGETLESVLLKPLDLQDIESRIGELRHEREQVERELEDAAEATEELPEVQERVTQLEADLADLEKRRASLAEGNGDGAGVGDQREELSEAKAERESVTGQIARLEEAIERIDDELCQKRDALSDLKVPETPEDLAAEIEDRQERLEAIERDAELLQSIYGPTRRIIDEARTDLITDVERDLVADSLTCWTCGSDVTADAIRVNLEQLGERITDLREQAADHRQAVEQLQERRDRAQRSRRERADLEVRIADLEERRSDHEASLQRVRERADRLDERIDELSETVDEGDAALTDLESEIKYTRTRIEETRETVEKLEARAGRREMLEAERAELTNEIEELRDRKETLKQEMRAAFDEAIADVIERFDTGFELARMTTDFDLVVARNGREASLDALSEGELELVGIVAALAGFEAYNVAEDVPIMLLDGLGGLADDNLRELVEYLSENVDYLVFTAYPENSPVEDHTIDPTDWSVVSAPTEADGE
jgi:chromosome segregation ATPase